MSLSTAALRRPLPGNPSPEQVVLAGTFGAGLVLLLLASALSERPLVFPLYSPLVDLATVLCMAVVATFASLDVMARDDTRSLPLAAAAAAIGILWLPHLAAFPLNLPRGGTAIFGQASFAIMALAQLATPSLLVVAFLQPTGPVAQPGPAVRDALLRAVGFGLFAAGLAAAVSPLLPALVVGGHTTAFNRALDLAALVPAGGAVVVFLLGRRGDRRMEVAMAAALILIIYCQLTGFLTHAVYDARWYLSNLLHLLPVFAIAAGQLALYSDTIAVERARVKHLSLLQGITHDIVASLDLDTVLGGVVRSTAEVVSSAQRGAPARAVLFRVEDAEVSVMACHELGLPARELERFPLQSAPILESVLRTGEGRVARVRRSRGRVAWPDDPLAGPDVAAVAYAPVASRDGVVGILGAASSGRRGMDDEVLGLVQGVADLAALAMRNATAYRTISDVAAVDPLTALPNRREFERLIESARGEQFAILSIDMDELKTINDQYGHQAGDRVLGAVARGLAMSFRGHDLVARVGGDEFAALLPGADSSTASAAADRVRASIRALDVPYGAKRLSIGIASGAPGADPREVWGWADEALYRAKKKGRDRAESFEGQVLGEARAAQRWADLIPQLLRPSGIVSLYQPIVRLSDRRLVGYEALARPSADLGLESVEGLFSTATKIGMGSELDWFGRRAAIVGASGISTDKELFVNVSVPALLDPLHDVDQMELLLGWASRTPEQVVLEISEREAVTDMGRFEEVLSRYRAAGFRFAIDDVGEGHSTLEVLAASSPEYIKIAASLARGPHRPGARAAVAALVTFARSLGAAVIAEGLETMDQVAAMSSLGVDLGQGYYLGRPAAVRRVALPKQDLDQEPAVLMPIA